MTHIQAPDKDGKRAEYSGVLLDTLLVEAAPATDATTLLAVPTWLSTLLGPVGGVPLAHLLASQKPRRQWLFESLKLS